MSEEKKEVLDKLDDILNDVEKIYLFRRCHHASDTFLGACERLRKTSDSLLIKEIRLRFREAFTRKDIKCPTPHNSAGGKE